MLASFAVSVRVETARASLILIGILQHLPRHLCTAALFIGQKYYTSSSLQSLVPR